MATWAAVRSLTSLPVGGGTPQVMAEQPCHCSFPPRLIPILLFCVFPSPPIHQTWRPQGWRYHGDNEVSCGSWRCLTWLNLSPRKRSGECLPRRVPKSVSPGQKQREDQCPLGHPHSFIHSAATCGLTLGVQAGCQAAAPPKLRDSGGGSPYTQKWLALLPPCYGAKEGVRHAGQQLSEGLSREGVPGQSPPQSRLLGTTCLSRTCSPQAIPKVYLVTAPDLGLWLCHRVEKRSISEKMCSVIWKNHNDGMWGEKGREGHLCM